MAKGLSGDLELVVGDVSNPNVVVGIAESVKTIFVMANSAELDYYRILEGMKKGYARMQDTPRAGLAAGPRLFKDTM